VQDREPYAPIIADVQQKVRTRQYRLTAHAEREREADSITIQEIEEGPTFTTLWSRGKLSGGSKRGELFITRIYGARAPSACCLWCRIVWHVDHCHRIPTRPRTVDRLEDPPGL